MSLSVEIDVLIPCPFSGFDVETLIEQVSKTTPVPIPHSPPPNYGAIFTVVLGALTLLLSVRYFAPIFTSRWVWAALVIGASIIFTSGFMFVRIRGSPWVAHHNGQPQWMAGGYQSQYGMEVQVIGAICALSFLTGNNETYLTLMIIDLTAAFSYTALIFLVPQISSPSKQRLGVYIWCTLSVVLLAILLSFLRIKNPGWCFQQYRFQNLLNSRPLPGYPFRLFF